MPDAEPLVNDSLLNPFVLPEQIKSTLILSDLYDEFKDSVDPVHDMAKAINDARSERDRYQMILESEDGIDILIDEQKIDRARFPHWVVRVIAHALSGIFDIGKLTASFTVNDPVSGAIKVMIVRENLPSEPESQPSQDFESSSMVT